MVEQSAGSAKTHLCSLSPSARERGVHYGLALPLLRKRFPDVEVVERNPEWEDAVREEMDAFLRDFTPDVEIGDGGLAFLDLTGTPALREGGASGASGLPDLSALAERIKKGLAYRVGLGEISVGMAPSRLLARVLAKMAAPEGTRTAMTGFALSPLSVDVLPGLSPLCREKLRKYGLKTIGQVSALARESLQSHFGAEGDKLHALARGLDFVTGAAPGAGPAAGRRDGPGLRAESVFPWDANDREVLLRKVHVTVDQLCFRMRRQNALGRRFVLELRYTDGKSVRRSFALPRATDALVPIAEAARAVFVELSRRRVALKSVALSLSRMDKDTGQLDLFTDADEEKQRRIGAAVLKVREKTGFEAILTAADLTV